MKVKLSLSIFYFIEGLRTEDLTLENEEMLKDVKLFQYFGDRKLQNTRRMCVCVASKPPICIAIIHHLYALTFLKNWTPVQLKPKGQAPRLSNRHPGSHTGVIIQSVHFRSPPWGKGQSMTTCSCSHPGCLTVRTHISHSYRVCTQL